MVAEVSLGRAGIVLGLECSRLARNNADWHQLLELCAMTGTLICDEDGLYDPRSFNDRMLLGLKGTMAESELHFIKARLRGGQLSKARRGELIMPLPVGLAYDAAGHVILDPDAAVQGAVRHLLATFEATGSATAVVKAFSAAGLPFPWRHQKGPRKGETDWQPPRHHAVLRVLRNPRYAGAFAYGRTAHQIRPGGRACARKLPRDQWTSFIPGAHPGYITLDQYEANVARLTANAAAHGRDRAAGPPREGPALLQGLIICGRCGLRMTVRHHARGTTQVPDYMCQRDGIENGRPACAAIPGGDLDRAVGGLLIATLTPLAVEAALQVSAELEHRASEADALRAAHVERAQYHADLARRRYLAVDPANRLVAGTLEADWNTALRALSDAQETYDKARREHAGQLTDANKARIAQLVTDLPGIWNDPATPQRERKRIARLLLADVTATRTGDTITAHVRLAGGQHHALAIPAPLLIGDQRRTPAEVLAAIDELLDRHTTGEIAGILNQRGMASGTGEPFHRLIVDHIIRTYRLRSRRSRLRATGMLTLAETAAAHRVHPHTIKAWRRAVIVTGTRYNDKGEFLYDPPDPANPPCRPKIGRRPKNL
jgi:DNA invertase Pin-like site-specific DNA recombinase